MRLARAKMLTLRRPLRIALLRTVTTALAAVAALVSASCAAVKAPPSSQVDATAEQPLSYFASARIMAMPTQLFRTEDAMGWAGTISDPRAYLASADSAIERELRARNYAANWIFPAELVRSAKRNPTYASDPTTIRAADAVRRLERKATATLAEPAASQLRVLAGLHDARYALVPVELRFEPSAAGGTHGKAVLHLALVDIRGARLDWTGDVSSDESATLTPTLLTSLARHFADLIAPR